VPALAVAVKGLRYAGRAQVPRVAGLAVWVNCLRQRPFTAKRSDPQHLTIASGSTQGVYYPYSKALSMFLSRDVPGLSASIVTTSGAGENIRLVAENNAQLGFRQQILLTLPGAMLISCGRLARIYDDYIHVVVRANSPAKKVRDLKGLKVSTGPRSSSTELVAGRVLDSAGLRSSDFEQLSLGVAESAAALTSGKIDAFFWSGGLPTKAIEDLAMHVSVRLLSLAMRCRSSG